MVLQIYKFYFSIFYIYKTLTILHVYKFFSTFSSFLHIFLLNILHLQRPQNSTFLQLFFSFFYISTAKKKRNLQSTKHPPPPRMVAHFIDIYIIIFVTGAGGPQFYQCLNLNFLIYFQFIQKANVILLYSEIVFFGLQRSRQAAAAGPQFYQGLYIYWNIFGIWYCFEYNWSGPSECDSYILK